MLIFSGELSSKTKQISYGIEEYGQEKLLSLQGFGIVKLQGTKVVDSLEVNGELDAHGCELGRVKVNGYGLLENCLVKKRVVVQGVLEATNTQFYDQVVLASEQTIFENCSLAGIQVRESGKDEIVELKGKSIVSGAIKFDSGRGIVIKGSEVEFSGKLIGGTFQ